MINAYADDGDGNLEAPEFTAGAAATDTPTPDGAYSLTAAARLLRRLRGRPARLDPDRPLRRPAECAAPGRRSSPPRATRSPSPPARPTPATTSATSPKGDQVGEQVQRPNGNGSQDGGERGLAGWVINAYADDGDGNLEAPSPPPAPPPPTHRRRHRHLQPALLAPGSYVVCEVAQAGWTQTAPSGDRPSAGRRPPVLAPEGYAITLTPGQTDTGNDFGNFQQATKSGTKFNDLNGDGEPGRRRARPGRLGDQRLRDDDGDGNLDAGEHRRPPPPTPPTPTAPTPSRLTPATTSSARSPRPAGPRPPRPATRPSATADLGPRPRGLRDHPDLRPDRHRQRLRQLPSRRPSRAPSSTT